MSGSAEGGVDAQVGARKRDADGNVVQEEGFIAGGHSRRGWAIFITLVVLSVFGIWKLIELIPLAWYVTLGLGIAAVVAVALAAYLRQV